MSERLEPSEQVSVPTLQLFNSLSGKLEPFVPLDDNKVKMYVCGPTVYDDAHLGHARCYITWDVLYRFLKFLGYDVKYVRNVTDVDDKILNRAKERGESPAEVAQRNYESFQADMAALNILPPDEEPRATQYIGEMLIGIQALIAKGAAYVTPDGSVYFKVSSKADYGKLKYRTADPAALSKHLQDLQAGARVEIEEGKASPLDFALWKAVPLEDPNGWESPWPAAGQQKGWGRPGWHMECSAMNHAVFGEQIDIHAGGADLIFPHHENEIAQSEAWTGKAPFARYWLHNGFVNVSGEKMSKSLGNFSSIKKVLERYDANTIRYFLLTNGYRMPVDFNDEALASAQNWLLDNCKRTLQSFLNCTRLTPEAFKAFALQSVHDEKTIVYLDELHDCISAGHKDYQAYLDFYEGMLHDLNTAKSVAALNIGLRQLRLAPCHPLVKQGEGEELLRISSFELALTTVATILTILGFDVNALLQPEASRCSEDERLQVEQLLQQRKQAKADKNWAQADAIRNQLAEQGIAIMDNKDGTTSWELKR